MKNLIIFILGFFVGMFFLFVLGFRHENTIKKRLLSELINISENLINNDIQFIEVKGKKGMVTLNTNMSKDSVKILLGKPDKVNLRSYGNRNLEDWGYNISNKYIPDLNIQFENGIVKGVRND